MTRGQAIEARLRQELAAVHVEVIDESHLHEGHAGAREGGGHFRVTVVSPRFMGLNRVQAQRLVYHVLQGEMGNEIHALSIKTATPQDWDDAGPPQDS